MKRILIISTLVLIGFASLSARADSELTLDDLRRYVEDMSPQGRAVLADIIANANKDLPKMIDSITRLEQITVDRNGFRYNITVTADPEIAAKVTMKEMKYSISKALCKGDDTIVWIKKGFTYTYTYWDRASKYLGSVVVSKMDCDSVRL